LRDLIRAVSDGDAAYGLRPERVSLADERSEIAAVYDGVPQLDVGAHTDVLDACPKAQAVIMLLRAMNPNVVALDEVTAERDVAAIISAANCGARIFATAHAAGEGDLRRRPVYRLLRECGVFEKTVTITRECGVRRYRVSDAQSEATA
jgi:stage III sporulation protein AA